MNTAQLECFIDLAETLNFSITAQRMYLTQPTVSNKIKQLEKEIGVSLFKRTKRSVELTNAGASFYRDMKEVVAAINQGVVRACNYAQKYESRYVIAYENNDLAIRYLSNVIEIFMSKYPHIQIELKMIDFRQKSTMFFEGKADFLFTIRDAFVDMLKANYRELYTGHFICVVSEKNELSRQDKITFSELNGQTLILLNPSFCPEEMMRMEEKLISACPSSPVLLADNQLSGCTMAKCGLGIAVMPDFIYSTDAALCIVPLETEDVISYGALWHAGDNREYTKDMFLIAKEVYGTESLVETNTQKRIDFRLAENSL